MRPTPSRLSVSRLAVFAFVLGYLYLNTFASSSYYSMETEYLPRGARALSMGGTGCAAVDDAFAAFYNPAAILLKHPSFMVEYSPLWNLGDNFWTGSLVFPFEPKLAVAGYYSHLGINEIPYFGELEGTSESDRQNDISKRSTGVPLGLFSDTYELFGFTMAKGVQTEISQETFYKLTIPVTVSGGLTIKLFRQTFSFDKSLNQADYIGQSSDLDVGVLASFQLDKDMSLNRPTKLFRVGYSFKNLLETDVKWNTNRNYTDNGERIRLLGLYYGQEFLKISGRGSFTLDFIRRNDEQVERYGIEYGFKDMLFIRSGWMDKGITAGIGIRYKNITADYAFQHNTLKNRPYQITLAYSF